MSPITNEDLKAIRERAEKATSGPWRTEWGHDEFRSRKKVVGTRIICGMQFELHMPIPNDAEFIAHARTDVPALLDEIERLKGGPLTDKDLAEPKIQPRFKESDWISNQERAWMTDEMTLFTCGKPRDHECDSDGPTIYGGDNVPTVTDPAKAGKGYTWGTVTCSKCGRSSMENGMWD